MSLSFSVLSLSSSLLNKIVIIIIITKTLSLLLLLLLYLLLLLLSLSLLLLGLINKSHSLVFCFVFLLFFFLVLLKIVELDGFPDNVGFEEDDDLLLKHGIEVKIPSIPDEPMIVNGEIQEPLEKSEFDINFLGINGKEVKSNVKVTGRKIWFAPSTQTFSNLISVTVRENMFSSDNLARHLFDLNLS